MLQKNTNDLKEMKATIGSWGRVDRRTLNTIKKFAYKTVLDIGCATGSYVRYLNDHGYTAKGCDALKDPAWELNPLDYKVCDIEKLPYKNNSFETILLLEILEHITNISKALKEVHRVTKKNIIISVPNCIHHPIFPNSGLAFHHWVDRTRVNFFTIDSIQRTLKENGFRIKTLAYTNAVMPEALLLYSYHIPQKISAFIGKACQILPFRRKYFMTIIVVAEKI